MNYGQNSVYCSVKPSPMYDITNIEKACLGN